MLMDYRRLWWADHVTKMGETRSVYIILTRKPHGKRSLERVRGRWVRWIIGK
jgi:hypothetical protein